MMDFFHQVVSYLMTGLMLVLIGWGIWIIVCGWWIDREMNKGARCEHPLKARE
jgi:hypothetical protein